MKLIIGTSNLHKNYGFLKNKINLNVFKKIISSNLKKKKDFAIDIAPGYGLEEIKKISSKIKKKIKIFSKIPRFPKKNYFEHFKKQFVITKKKGSVKTIYGLMLHDENDCLFLKDNKIVNYINKLKINRNIKEFGISVYNLDKLENYLKKFKFDFVQLPINPINLNKKRYQYLKRLKKKYKIKLIARSIFFQGILLNTSKKKSLKFLKHKKKLLGQLSKKYNVSRLDFIISYIENLNLVDYFLFGVNNFKQYNEIVNYKNVKISNKDYFKLSIKNLKKTDLRNIK